ncbi:CAP domain-containing protein, partial [Nocardiopsis trehalosi]|uniref:CAP domain-containing protein n=1 Tax=Nocardiopsis trehalosi TaxID=109329 RepID=UPI000A007AA9
AAGPAGGAAAAPGGEPPTAADDFFADAQAAPADGPADGPTGGAAEPPAQASAAEAAGTLTASAAPSPSPEDGADGDGDGDGGDPGSGGAGDPPASAQAVVELTNRERAEAGCAPLRVDGALTRASQAHSEDMAARDYMGHETPEGVGPAERAEDAGYTAWSGENVAAGYGSAEAVMAGWMDSPGHRANILNCDNTEIGVGESDARWTQNFGRD